MIMRLEGQVFDFFVKRSITCPRDLSEKKARSLRGGLICHSSYSIMMVWVFMGVSESSR